MNMPITPDVQRLIEQRMASGNYATPDDVLRAALHSLEQGEELGEFGPGELDALLAEGEQSGPALDGEGPVIRRRS